MRRLTPRVPSTAAITKRRRRAIVLPSSGSSDLEKIVFTAFTRDGPDFGLGSAVPAGSNAEFAILSPRSDHRPVPSSARTRDVSTNASDTGEWLLANEAERS